MRKGVRAGSRTLMVHVYARPDQVIQGGPRFGLVVSKQVGNAVTRHAVSRKLRNVVVQRELVDKLGRAPDVLVVAVSTTGTIGGCLRHIREHGYDTHVVAVDAAGSVLFDGTRGPRLLPGYGAGVVPDLSTEVDPGRVIRVEAADAVRAARRLGRTKGFLPGASGGAVAHALHELLEEGARGDIVGIFHDDGRAYLDTVYNDEWVEAHIGGLE